MAKRRSKFVDAIVGICAEFPLNQLPTKVDVIKNILFHKIDDGDIIVANKQLIKKTVERIKIAWSKTDIQTVADTSIERCALKIFDRYLKLKQIKHHKCYESQFNAFQMEMTSLFDISRCKCEDKCVCSYVDKIPKKEKQFLIDQRNERRMFLGSIDVDATCQAESREKRKHNSKNDSPMPKRKTVQQTSDNDSPVQRSRSSTAVSVNTKRIPLTHVSREIQRFGISLSGAATLCNALLIDLGIGDAENMLDRIQIHRNVAKFNKQIATTHTQKIQQFVNESKCVGLYFDGKKDKSKTFELNNETLQRHPRVETEDHYSIVLQPNNLYYATITPKSSKAIDIAQGIFDKLKEDAIDVTKIKIGGGDGTNVNTGEHGGEPTTLCVLNALYFSC